MPILIKQGSLSFQDAYGNIVSDIPTGNPGSIMRMFLDIEESVVIQSMVQKPIFFDENSLTFTFQDYESLNGFKVGGNIVIRVTLSNSNTDTQTTTITGINYGLLTMTVNSIVDLNAPYRKPIYDGSNRVEIYQTDLRADIILNLNFTDNSLSYAYDKNVSTYSGQFTDVTGSYRSSLIDGTFTRLVGDSTGVTVGNPVTLTQIGYKSGMYEVQNVIMTRDTDYNAYTRVYNLAIDFMINPSCFFVDGQKLNFYFDIEWYSDPNISLHPTVYQWNFKPSNTGNFDEAFNNQQPDAVLTTGISQGAIYYDSTTSHTVQITSVAPDLALGATYCPNDPTYYKNKYISQTYISMLNLAIETALGVIIPATYSSANNPDGAGYDIEVTAVSYSGGIYDVSFDFIPNAAFKTFMAGRSDEDRYFNIWAQSGNTNVLLFEGQLTETPNATVSLDTVKATTNWADWISDKSSITQDALQTGPGGFFSLQDNAMLKAKLLLIKNRRYNQVTFQMVAAEIADNSNFFELESRIINLSTQTYVDSTGITEFDIEQPKNDGLPLTSGQTNIRVTLIGAEEPTVNEFGTDLYYPVLMNWRDWIKNNNASSLFYPNQNQNWINYFSSGYAVYLRVFLEAENVNYEYFFKIGDLYDFNELRAGTDQWQGTASIEYYINSTGQQMPGLIKGEVMRVKVIVNNGAAITAAPGLYWGQMAIEPYKSSPWFTLSTNYDHDNNPSSPIYPLTGETRLFDTLVSSDQVTYEALIDVNKLPLQTHTIYLKHYCDNPLAIEQVRLSFESPILNYPQFGFNVDLGQCCDVMKVFASTTSDDLDKNNVTSAWWPLVGSDDVEFTLLNSSCQPASYQPTKVTFPNEPNAVYVTIPWVQVLSSLTDGAGKYTLKVTYTPPFGGDPVVYIWGVYQLMEYSDSAAFGLVRLVAQFDNNQFIEGINFRGSGVTDCLNVPGSFGKRDPKPEIINTTLSNRIVSSTKRENRNEYELKTVPIQEWFTKKLIDLYALSETDIHVSCINQQHTQYRLKRCVVANVPKPDYPDGSLLAVATVVMGDKVIDQRTIY